MPTNTMPARELILAALAQTSAPLTVTDLAEAAGVGKSTVSKYLPALEKEELAVRTPGGREGRRRLPDHWQAAPTTSTEPDPTAHEATTRVTEDLENADTAPSIGVEAIEDQQVHSQDTAPAGTGEAGPPAPSEKPAPADTRPATEPAPTPAPANAAPVSNPSAPAPRASATPARGPARTATGEEALNPVSGSRRLAQGELKTMVWALLKADPEEEFTATELSHILQGRSIGAIQNNLAKLAREGKVELACDRPRRYRFVVKAG